MFPYTVYCLLSSSSSPSNIACHLEPTATMDHCHSVVIDLSEEKQNKTVERLNQKGGRQQKTVIGMLETPFLFRTADFVDEN